jgi:uracil phosphoribosyltransferase
MVEGILKLVPHARVGHIACTASQDPGARGILLQAAARCQQRDLIVVDPMLATGGSAVAAISFIKNRGGKPSA